MGSKNSLCLYVKRLKLDLSRSLYHGTQLLCSMSNGDRIKQKNKNRGRRNNVRGLAAVESKDAATSGTYSANADDDDYENVNAADSDNDDVVMVTLIMSKL